MILVNKLNRLYSKIFILKHFGQRNKTREACINLAGFIINSLIKTKYLNRGK